MGYLDYLARDYVEMRFCSLEVTKVESLRFFECSCDERGGNTVKRTDGCHNLQFLEYRIDLRVEGGGRNEH